VPISAPSSTPLLQVAGLSAGYGKIGVLNGIDLTVGPGEIVALLGPNGAGKSTLLKAVSGLLPRTGNVTFGGQDISRAGPGDTVRLGLVHVVEGHRVFTQQTVYDNLLLAGYGMPRGELGGRVEEALGFFPEIAAKRADRAITLSGGQQQMLAVAQGLVRRPRLLMLDEPSAGLSPRYVLEIFERIVAINKSGVGILMVEQNARQALAIASRGFVLAGGRNLFTGTGRQLLDDPEVARSFLGGTRPA
jgi:branched-chain amino acid transport system ATP-binding protein